jgi:nitrile hydratase accessory protein
MIAALKSEQVRELDLPRDDATPVFAAPWQASAFATVLALYRAGHFEWGAWVGLLSQEIATAPPDPTGTAYYDRWARALEKLLENIGLITPELIAARSEEWRQAYLATPHGKEVRLTNARSEI